MMQPLMTATVSLVPPEKATSFSSKLERWHDSVRSSVTARLMLFAVSTTVLFALYLVCNWPHLGANARMHWDAETSICTSDPMPTASQLAFDRAHIYDVARETGSTDPLTVTAYFSSGRGASEHAPLEGVRRYYSQISYLLGRAAFNLGAKSIGTPLGGVLFFQLAAMLMVSVSMGLLFSIAVLKTPPGPEFPIRLGMVCLVFFAISTQIIFLSIARQVLTETVGLFFLVCVVIVLAAAFNPKRSLSVAIILSAALGLLVFATIRARYNLGPSIALLVPLTLLTCVPAPELVWKWKRYLLLCFIALVVFLSATILDFATYGPFVLPWVYDQTLVKSAALYFHADPPYALFWVMIYNNFPLLLLPLVVVAAACSGGLCMSDERISRRQLLAIQIYCVSALLILGLLSTMMARQAVGYQGRHFFAISVVAVFILFMIVGRIKWNRIQIALVGSICLLVTAMNLHSSFGPQTLVPGTVGRPLGRESFSARWVSRKNKASLLLDLINGYYVWADDDRLHDPLLALQYISNHAGKNQALLLIEAGSESGKWIDFLSRRFAIARVYTMNASAQGMAAVDGTAAVISRAQATGCPVYFFAPRKTTNRLNLHAVDVQLDRCRLYQVAQ